MPKAKPRSFLGLGLVCLVLGFSLTFAVKTQYVVQEKSQAGRVTDEEVAQFLAATQERDRLREELARLKDAASQQATVAQVRAELLLEQASAGLVGVDGPGVAVTLADQVANSGATLQVTPRDVLLVLNELKAGGADAIALNGVRVTSRLSLAQEGRNRGRLIINGKPSDGPVRIEAVGDPELLSTSLNLRGGVLAELTVWLKVSVTKSDRISIPPLAATPDYIFAVPRR
ncbi:MAG TPA: DUF881 domain-containing protein [Symbiobacteriaceae bacterium]|jgi:uncharacterized protein YlxW (UPF0749 family)